MKVHHPTDTRTNFDEHHVINELKHYLPTQTPLKDFIHHNTLHAFQGMKFYDAIFKASEIFGFEVTFPLMITKNCIAMDVSKKMC